MKAIEFQSQLTPDLMLPVPVAAAGAVPHQRPVRVLVLIAEDDDEQAWEQLAAVEFGQGYAESDAIYDQLPGR